MWDAPLCLYQQLEGVRSRNCAGMPAMLLHAAPVFWWGYMPKGSMLAMSAPRLGRSLARGFCGTGQLHCTRVWLHLLRSGLLGS